MRLTVIGCSGSFPGPEGPASCYLVEADGFRVVVDLGSGALGPLQRHCAIGDIDAVVLSHLHPDHCMDMLPLYVARTYDPTTTYDRLSVYGPSGAGAHLSGAYKLGGEPGLSKAFEFIDIAAGPQQVGPLRVTAVRTSHPIETWGMRIEHDGRTLAYSADSGPCDQLVDLAAGADLFLCEASYREGNDNPPDLHVTGREAGQIAEHARVERLVITHVPPWHDPEDAADEAQSSYDGLVVVARSGASYEI
ncbi:MAG: MBL fold metallo-hydrolase [Sporichthyaceae bacterium]